MPQPAAKQLQTDTSNFDGALSSSEDSVQKALDVLDDAVPAGATNTVTTTDATVTTITTIPIPDNTVVLIDAYILGRRTDSADRAVYIRRAAVYREAAGSATLQGSVDSPLTRESAGGYNATIAVSGNNAIITVKGLGGNTINWSATHKEMSVA